MRVVNVNRFFYSNRLNRYICHLHSSNIIFPSWAHRGPTARRSHAVRKLYSGIRPFGSEVTCLIYLRAGLMDYEAALKLDTDNESLRQDAQKIRSVVEGSSSVSVDLSRG